jgi:thioredoxin
MASTNVLEVTDANFESHVLGSSLPFLLDCWAAGCAPCRTIAPIVDALAQQYAGKLRVGKCDVGANPMAYTHCEIRTLPTLLLFRNGQVIGNLVGAAPRAKIEDMVKTAL